MCALAGAILLLLAVLIVRHSGPAHAGLVAGPVAAAALVALVRWAGLSWDDLGLARASWRSGAAYGLGAIAIVAVVYAVAAWLPATRTAFLDSRYRLDPGAALVTAFLVIPIGTVLLEEVAFRGALPGLVRHRHGVRWATAFSSVLFGLWHVVPSLRLATANPAVEAVFGPGAFAEFLVVASTVVFTAGAGVVLCELRWRSGSLIAAAALHWATNGLGVVVALIMWHTVGA